MVDQSSFDYIVVGAGIAGLAFTDTLIAESKARVAIVDRRATPGGHWNDAYPFIHLHLPSHMYGVNSRRFDRENENASGLDRHLLHMASGAEVLAYCQDVVDRVLLPSGQVTYLPEHDFDFDCLEIRHLKSGSRRNMRVTKAVVDATYTDTRVAKLQKPSYAVEAGLPFVSIDRLPSRIGSYDFYCVIGAGKTGIDACLSLLENDILPERIRWIVPRDAWWMRRERLQFTPTFAKQSLTFVADQLECLLEAQTIDEMFLAFEERGVAARLDPATRPTMYHGASISDRELAQLRRLQDVIRKGRVVQINCNTLHLERGSVANEANTLFVDCSASGLSRRPTKKVFDAGRITLQMVKPLRQAFSAAIIGWIEVNKIDQNRKNRLCNPMAAPDVPEHWLEMQMIGSANQKAWSEDESLMDWIRNSRLDPGSRLLTKISHLSEQLKSTIERIGAAAPLTAAAARRLIG